jgi:hypothetical protein
MTNLYQSDVRSLSDDELEALSEELAEEYRCSGYEEDYWTDDAAETRYWQLHTEARRRWEISNPELAAISRAFIAPMVKSILESIEAGLLVAKAMSPKFRGEFKIGDTVTVRKPYRFQE